MSVKMKQHLLDTVGRFYSPPARYPLHTVESGAVVIAERTDSKERHPPHRRCVVWIGIMEDRAILTSVSEFTASLREVVAGITVPTDLMNPETIADVVTRYSTLAGGSANVRLYLGRKHCCDAEMLSPVHDVHVHRLTRENAPDAMRVLKPVGIPDDLTYLLAENTAFAYFQDDIPVAFAGTHPTGDMSDSIGDVMVGTLAEHRRRGFGQAVISATTGAVVAKPSSPQQPELLLRRARLPFGACHTTTCPR